MWPFFATSHGKSPCDGLGGTIKRLTARASLQRPKDNQILSAEEMFKFCEAEIDGIVCTFIKSETVIEVRQQMQERYASANTLPGTRTYHQFIPLSHSKIGAKYVSEEEQFAFTFDFNIAPKSLEREVKLSEFVSCIYNECPWIGVVEEIDVKVKLSL